MLKIAYSAKVKMALFNCLSRPFLKILDLFVLKCPIVGAILISSILKNILNFWWHKTKNPLTFEHLLEGLFTQGERSMIFDTHNTEKWSLTCLHTNWVTYQKRAPKFELQIRFQEGASTSKYAFCSAKSNWNHHSIVDFLDTFHVLLTAFLTFYRDDKGLNWICFANCRPRP